MIKMEAQFKNLEAGLIDVKEFTESLKTILKESDYIDTVQNALDTNYDAVSAHDAVEIIPLVKILDYINEKGWFSDILEWNFKKSDLESQIWDTIEHAFGDLAYDHRGELHLDSSLNSEEYDDLPIKRKFPYDAQKCDDCAGEDCACCEIAIKY